MLAIGIGAISKKVVSYTFEGCMKEKGWQRMEYVPYQRAKEGREVFSETVFGPNSQYSRDHDGKSAQPMMILTI